MVLTSAGQPGAEATRS